MTVDKPNIDNKRNSSIELLRIISMILIIFHHFALHGDFDFSSSSITVSRLWYYFIIMGGKIGVNIFILISGYFLISNKKIEFNLKKIIKLWGQILFYSITILVLSILITNNYPGIKIIIKSMLPITFSLWGFASGYFVLYLFHPFINRLLHSLTKNEYIILIGLQFICWCVIPTFTGQLFQSNTLLWYIFLYCIAGYLKLYGQNINKKTSFYFIIFIVLYAMTYLSSVVFSVLGLKWEIFANHSMYFFGPEKISTFLVSVSMFIAFASYNMPYSKWINRIASTTFGIYLLHDNPIVRNYLWNILFHNNKYQDSSLIIPYSIMVCCAVFIGCGAIDWLRKIVAKKLFDIDKLEPHINSIKEKYSKYIKN